MEKISDKCIKDFLETAPLYSWKEFNKPDINRSNLWIKEIDSFCETCNQWRPFQDMRPRGGGAGMAIQSLTTGTSYFQFSCASCCGNQHEYLVEQIVTDETIKIQKYGERPRKKLERDPLLQNFFSHDSECYEKAVVCISNGYGIAAFAYMRRIIERNIHELLSLIQEDVEGSEREIPVLAKLAELRAESPMSDKISIANHALPDYLIPSGLNPLGRLYKVLSEGVHSYDDGECLERAKAIQACIKYLISELAARKKNRESFKNLIGGL
ncbi:hypothetical protein ACSFVZ_02890 [Pseudoalteromonas sp. SYSU M81236]|jgi:hypothetical protein|uniref:hypothetical protein n=1 Tax=Pseudoalteromonas sp. SYSU M81236 TaxID=3447014 RepID=UPI003F076CD1